MEPTAKLSFKIAAGILMPLARMLVRLEIRDRENLPAQGPVIAICNHLHLLDPILHIFSILPRDSIFLAKEELFHPLPNPFFFVLMKIVNAICVPRRGTDEERRGVIEKSLRVLEEGLVLGIYPEGKRSETAQLNLAYPGVTRLALRSGAPLIPISIYGTEKLSGIGWLKRPRVVITFGKIFHLAKPDQEPSFTKVQQLTGVIMEQLCSILPPQYHGKYGKQTDATTNPNDS